METMVNTALIDPLLFAFLSLSLLCRPPFLDTWRVLLAGRCTQHGVTHGYRSLGRTFHTISISSLSQFVWSLWPLDSFQLCLPLLLFFLSHPLLVSLLSIKTPSHGTTIRTTHSFLIVQSSANWPSAIYCTAYCGMECIACSFCDRRQAELIGLI